MFVGRYGDLPVGLRDRKAECNQSSLPLAISPTIEEYLARGGVITPTRTTEWFYGAGVTRANLVGEAWKRSSRNRSRGQGSSSGVDGRQLGQDEVLFYSVVTRGVSPATQAQEIRMVADRTR